MKASHRGASPRIKGLVLAVHAALGGVAWAGPVDGTVVNGQVAIRQAAPGSTHITASNGAIINWKQFSIGTSESVQFFQPSAASAVLNRVTGPGASLLNGALKANGQVFLINPSGIVVGGGARIDTNSFIASTLDISDADFLAGKLRFLAATGAGGIRNDGMITAGPGGRIALIAPDIQNTGIIRAPDGNILLAAGRKLEIASLDMEGVTFEIQAPTDSVLNLGKLLAENGAVRAFAGSLRHSGEVRASRLVQQSDGSIVLAGSNDVTLTADSVTSADGLAGGTVVVQSTGGTARVAGAVSATGSAGSGGDIRVLGQRVALDTGASLDVSGSQGGGQILVGGDFQGGNAGVQNALRVNVASGAVLKADATGLGDGGRVIVWADENTRYQGSLSAQGGPQGGNGGFAEVSGKGNLAFAGSASLGAPAGASGTLLLDPLDILVSATSGILPVVVDEFADFPSNVVTVSPQILSQLAANVTLQAERDIYIKDAIALSTPGAGLTVTAGGASYNGGYLYNNAGISTTGGAVTLRAETVFGNGGISTGGGAVDLLGYNSLGYAGQINSGGGMVTLASQTGSVSNARVNAGSGTIQVTGRSVSNGVYTTTGSANLSATAGSLSVSDINAGIANLNATSSINATVNVSDRVNATSTGSSVTIRSDAAGPLRLGTLSSVNSGLFIHSPTGMEQASGGLLTAPVVNLYAQDSSSPIGSVATPITVASPSVLVQPRVTVSEMAAPAHLAFSGGPTVGELSLAGTVAALGGSTVVGAANLSALSLGAAGGVLNVSATSTGGFASGFSLEVTDGAINAANLDLPGAAVDLTSAGPVTVGTIVTAGSLSLAAKGAVTIGSATTTGSAGMTVSTQSCANNDYVACAAISPVTATTLNAGGTGSVTVYTLDNGNVSVTNLSAGGDVNVYAGNVYYTAPGFPYTTQRTTNDVSLGTVVAGRSVTVSDRGQGNLGITSLSGGTGVSVDAGGQFSPSYNVYQRTSNGISIGNTAVAGATNDFRVTNNGIGNISLTGVIDQTVSGDITLSAAQGSVTSTGNLLARDSITVTGGGSGLVTLAQVTAGSVSSNGSVTISAGGNLLFDAVTATAVSTNSGNVSLSSAAGSVKTSSDSSRLDVSATGNVTITAADTSNGFIGDSGFARPLDIKAGATKAVTLAAGRDIGSSSDGPVTVDTGGSLTVSTSDGHFYVAATDGVSARQLSTVRLSASAAGIASGGNNDSTLTSQDLNVTATSNGSTITIGDVIRQTGTLNEFSFSATGSSALVFGVVDFGTAGLNQAKLSASNGLTQASMLTPPLYVNAGYVSLDGGSGNVTVGNVTASTTVGNRIDISGADIVTGDLTAPALSVTGNNLTLGAVSTSGTHRGYPTYVSIPRLGYSDYLIDELTLSADGNLTTSGNIVSATSALVSAGGNVTVAGGTGIVTAGGSSVCCYYTDTARVWAGTGSGTVSAGAVSGYSVDIRGNTVLVAGLSANTGGGSVSVTGTTLTTANIAGAYVTLSGDTLTTGTVTGTNLDLTGTTFATGDLTASNSLVIRAGAGYAPGNIALTANSMTVTAADDIHMTSDTGTTVTASTVTLRSTGGNVKAELTGTSNLTIDTAVGFNVSSDTWLDSLDVTAQWDQATGAASTVGATVSSSSGTGTQSFGYDFAVGGPQPLVVHATSSLTGSANWNLRYHDVSGQAVVAPGGPAGNDFANLTISHADSGTFDIAFDSGTRFGNVTAAIGKTVGASSSGANLTLSTGGPIHLNNVQTNGGSVSASSSFGDITFGTVNTSAEGFAGYVALYAYGGSIEVDGIGTSLISTATLCSTCGPATADPYGNVTLYAPSGSVGGTATIPLENVFGLYVTAQDTIAVNSALGNLSNINLTTGGSGAGTITITNPNFASLGITRNGGNLELGGFVPTAVTDFSLTATNGNLVVTGDIDHIGALRLDAGRDYNSTADLVIQASGGPRLVTANSTLELRAGRDVKIAAGAASGQDVSVIATGTNSDMRIEAGRDILVSGDGGAAIVSHAAAGYTMTVDARHDVRVTGGATNGASASVTGMGYQSLRADHELRVAAGAGDAASAAIDVAQTQYSSTIGFITVQAGGDNATASLSGGTQSFGSVYGTVSVLGGSGTGASARIEATTGNQDFGNSIYGQVTDVLVQGGSGLNATAGMRAAGSQTLYNMGNIQVLGGAGVGANAEIASASGNQSVGRTYTYYQPVTTQDILVQGGAGGSARIHEASGSQTIDAGGLISVLGGTGANTSATIRADGGQQTVGDSSTYYYNPTDNILVRGGGGADAFASLVSTGNQTIGTGGTISVTGGTGANAYAELASTAGRQNIGNTYQFSNDATGALTVQGGSGASAAARITAASGQTIDSGGAIQLLGGAAGAYAEVSSTGGTQAIGNINNASSYDQTDSIGLVGGSAAGSYAKLATGGFQTIRSAGAISLAGGTGDASGALMVVGGGQDVLGRDVLSITGGSGTTAGGNRTGLYANGGGQTLTMTGNLSVTGGTTGSDTGIVNLGSGQQTINISNGSLSVLAPAGSPNADGSVAVRAVGGGQSITVPNGTVSVDNAGATAASISAGGSQSITTRAMAISLSSPMPAAGGPLAEVSAAGNQTIRLNGDGVTQGSATLSVVNLSAQAGSKAALSAGGNLNILMDPQGYEAAGLVKIGDAAGQGRAMISAGGSLTMVAGQLLLQGGQGPGSDASLLSAQANPLVGPMTISTLYGPVELTGGTVGGAFIDPPVLSITSNGSVLLRAGTTGPSNVNINAGVFNLAATAGNLSLQNSTTSAATATITANTFSFTGPGSVLLNGGTVTVTTSGAVDYSTAGDCLNCLTNLIGPFNIRRVEFVPPQAQVADDGIIGLITAAVVALADGRDGPFRLAFDENGTLFFTNRRLNQCY